MPSATIVFLPLNPAFFDQIEAILHSERINAYRQDGASPKLGLARYLLNMALSEALYPTLQFAEIALRNSIHRALTLHCDMEAWYDSPQARLTPWQQNKVVEAKDTISKRQKLPAPGQIVAELHFGFWTGFLNKAHARTGIGSYIARSAFQNAPSAEQYQSRLDRRWQDIRDLRNRVFHHERILHWKDLDARHAAILEIISWMSPELKEMASALDRFIQIRSGAIDPWLDKIDCYWPVE